MCDYDSRRAVGWFAPFVARSSSARQVKGRAGHTLAARGRRRLESALTGAFAATLARAAGEEVEEDRGRDAVRGGRGEGVPKGALPTGDGEDLGLGMPLGAKAMRASPLARATGSGTS
jgi:hypothetical protein